MPLVSWDLRTCPILPEDMVLEGEGGLRGLSVSRTSRVYFEMCSTATTYLCPQLDVSNGPHKSTTIGKPADAQQF